MVMNTIEPKIPPGAMCTVIINPHLTKKIIGIDSHCHTDQTEMIKVTIPTRPNIVAIGIIFGQYSSHLSSFIFLK